VKFSHGFPQPQHFNKDQLPPSIQEHLSFSFNRTVTNSITAPEYLTTGHAIVQVTGCWHISVKAQVQYQLVSCYIMVNEVVLEQVFLLVPLAFPC
jgi:hypothetical protein